MRQLGPIVLALVLVTCGGAPQTSAPSATPSATAAPSASVAAVSTPIPSYAPAAEGFASKVLIEKPRTLSTSANGYVWIKPGAASDASGVSATISDKESFTASYQLSTEQRASGTLSYATPDLPPMAAGKYTEGLRLVTVQTGGRSAAHMHSGFEAVLILEGRVLIRSGGNAPTLLTAGQGFYILPKVPIQLINAGDGLARTLVYSISAEGAPFSTELPQSP